MIESAGGTYDEIQFGPEKGGWAYRFEIVSVECETAPCEEIRAYIKSPTKEFWIWEQDAPSADKLYWFTDDFFLTEGETLVFRFTGCASGDRLAAYLQGYRFRMLEGGTF